jgi:hypothetical protein
MTAFARCTLLSVSLIAFLLPKRTALACGFSAWPGEYRFWLLQPDLAPAADLAPFYFASTYLYHDDMTSAARPDISQNIDEWMAETGGAATRADIDSLLNNTSPADFFDLQRQASANTFLRWLRAPGHTEWMRYITLSKKVEGIAANPDPWDENGLRNYKSDAVVRELRRLHQEARSSFVQLRSAYQCLRLLGLEHDGLMQQIYDAWVAPVRSKSWVKAAALYQLAIRRSDMEGHYLLVQAYDAGYQRTPCLMRFDPEKTDSLLDLARNTHEQAVVLAMRAFNSRGRALPDIARIYALAPGHRDLPFLLLREINKIEDWLVTSRVTDFNEPAVPDLEVNYYESVRPYRDDVARNRRSDSAYAQQLDAFLQRVLAGRKKDHPLLQLYSAHLALVLGKPARARQQLDAVAATQQLSKKLRTQLRVSRLLLDLEDGFGPKTEARFLQLAKASDEELGVVDPDILRNQLVLYTSRKLRAHGDRVRGLMLLSQTNRALGELPISRYKTLAQFIGEEARAEDYDAMISILSKQHKSPFEKFVTRSAFRSPEEFSSEHPGPDSTHGYWDRNCLLDYKAGWYLRQHRTQEALATLQRIPRVYWNEYPYKDYPLNDPFYVNLYDINEESGIVSVNKLQAVQEIRRREQRLAAGGRQAAQDCYELGNAWFNMSYYGGNWLMTRQYWSQYEMASYPYRSGHVRRSPENDDYYGCRRARSYYEQGWRLARDRKLKTFCYYMMEQCDHRWKGYLAALAGIDPEKQPEYRSPQKSLLQQKGLDAAYYRELVDECQVYAAFIRGHRRK